MPQLPDVEVFKRNLNDLFAGKTISRIKKIPAVGTCPVQRKLTTARKGQKLMQVYRSGKEMRFQFKHAPLSGLHPMLTGDIHLKEEKKEFKTELPEIEFSDASSFLLTDK